jgi:hypothetical protein
MALWTPSTDKIGPNEHLGRRLLDKPQLIGALDQKPKYQLRLEHFLEKRGAGEVSLDRVGQSNVDKRVCRYLAERAIKAAGSFREPRQFKGWAVAHAKILRQPPLGAPHISVVPSPKAATELDELEENIYHADALPGGRSPYDMAAQLLWLFQEHGRTEYYKHELSWRERWRVLRIRFCGWFRPSFRE